MDPSGEAAGMVSRHELQVTAQALGLFSVLENVLAVIPEVRIGSDRILHNNADASSKTVTDPGKMISDLPTIGG